MKFVVAGGGVAGLASSLLLARDGHEVVVLERDFVDPDMSAREAFAIERRGIPHYFQPHMFLPRGRRILAGAAKDVLGSLLEAGAHPQDLTAKLNGPSEPGDGDLVVLWARRPLIEWALRSAAAGEDSIELRPSAEVEGLTTSDGDRPRARGVRVDGELIECDVVVDAMGRYRCPPDWPRAAGRQSDSGAIYYCRYFELAEGVDYHDAPILNPRGDLGYMGFNTFRGDNRTFAVILLAPAADRALRRLRHEEAWMSACSAINPLDVMTSSDYGRPITGVMPMGGLMNADRTGDPGTARIVAVGDAFCHTDPAFAYGLSFSLAHAEALSRAASEAPDADAVADHFRAAAGPEARERFELSVGIDAARAARWRGEPISPASASDSYPFFSFAGALAAAPHDDEVLRRTVRRIGLLDRTEVFDRDEPLHRRIEEILARIGAPPPPGPSREELLERFGAEVPRAG